MTATFVKRYRTSVEVDTALGHYRWLVGLAADIDFPALVGHTARTVEFEHFPGRTARPADLPTVAAALGRLHRTARRRGLDHALGNSRYKTASGLVLDAFAGPRRSRLHAVLRQGLAPNSPLSHRTVDQWLDHAAELPVALYKDANPRNVLISDHRGLVLVDFDSLTLAPVGYDLAKLLVTTAMTYGALPCSAAEETITTYSEQLDLDPPACSMAEIIAWSEFHHLLTHVHLGRHGYRHAWPAVRPWPASEAHDAVNTVIARSKFPPGHQD